MTVPPKKLTLERLGVDDGEVDGFDTSDDVKHAKKSEKTFKFQNLAKSRKKLLKSGNLTNFDATEARSKFLTPNAIIAFNRL